MIPSDPWDDTEDANGGYITVNMRVYEKGGEYFTKLNLQIRFMKPSVEECSIILDNHL